MMYPASVVNHSDGAVTVPLVGRIDPETMEAFRRWSEAEDRTLAAQLRVVLRDAIPVKYFNEETTA